jgi:acyl-CoA hydrolase
LGRHHTILIAHLVVETLREIAGELIAIAHPDFGVELTKEAWSSFDEVFRCPAMPT